ncbi:MAG TPA: hypothetical protein VF883_17370, partial [Thermoanaerobaculia bacterium]
MNGTSIHPSAETVAALAEGRLDARTRAAALEHVATCEDCTMAVEVANEAVREERVDVPAPAAAPRIWWLVAAAVAIATLIPLAILRPWRSPIDKLVAAAPQSVRVVEPRLSGGFGWAAYRGPFRTNAASDPARLRLGSAAADAIEQGDDHAAGIALLLVDDTDAAVSRLRAAAERAPDDAERWSDLAAAEYAAATGGAASSYPDALGHAERALRIDPRLPEALFNRALILDRMGLYDGARSAWERYLAVDPASEWSNEARQRLARPRPNAAADFERDRPLLERAASAGDAGVVAELAQRHRERVRALAEVEYLGRWAEAMQRGDAREASHWLTVARAIGDALAASSGESLLRDAVAAIARGPVPATAAEAHVAYRRARIAYSRQAPGDAEPELRRAAELFARAGSPMQLVARYYAACAQFDRGAVVAARTDLEALATELRTRGGYKAAAANVQWQLSLCRSRDGDWSGAMSALELAARTFEQLGESSNRAAIESLRAVALDVLGRPDDAWAARIRVFAIESRERRGPRLAGSLAAASTALARAGRTDAARALLAIEQEVHRATKSDGMLVHALAREAQLLANLGDDTTARRAAGEARAVAQRLPDAALRTRELAVADLASAAAELRRDPRQARDVLTRALDELRAAGLKPYVAEAALLRARASIRLGDVDAAARDLDAGLDALGRMQVHVAGGVAPGVYDTGSELLAEAVTLHLARGDVERAFAYVERSRVQLVDVVDTRVLRERLAGSGDVVLETLVIGSEVVTFAVTERELAVARRPLAQRNDTALYDAVIRPHDALLVSARRVVIVPDPALNGVAYAALSDGSKRLVERLPVAVAPSASLLVSASRQAPQSVLAVALPAGDAAPLPESEQELREIAAVYRSATIVPPSEPATFASVR